MPTLPLRFIATRADRERLGPAVDRLGAMLSVVDPLADDVAAWLASKPGRGGWAIVERALALGIDQIRDAPAPLVALFEELDRVPAWVRPEALVRGGGLLFRTGWFGGLALGVSLVSGYSSPAGNKPLVFSGQLVEQTPRRLFETSRFVEATCAPDGLRRFSPGFSISVRVRLMHAKVRHLLRASGRWNDRAWGAPINQHDMAATSLLFSSAVVDSLTKVGFSFDEEEIDLYMQLWRYSGHLLGVDAELLPASYRDALRLTEVIAATEAPPDDDSRALTRAFFAATSAPERATAEEKRRAERLVKLGQGLMRGVIGEPLARALDIPPNELRHALVPLRATVRTTERAREALPQVARERWRSRAIESGRAYWATITAAGLSPLEFAPPDELRRVPAASIVN